MSRSHVWDASTVASLDAIVIKHVHHGKTVTIEGRVNTAAPPGRLTGNLGNGHRTRSNTELKDRAETVAGKQADADPCVTETRHEAQQAHREQGRLVERHLRESIALSQRALAGSTPSRVVAHAAKLRKQAERDRRDLARIDALPVAEAVQFVRDLAVRDEAERQAAERAQAAREKRAAQLGRYRPSSDHGRTGPERDAPSL